MINLVELLYQVLMSLEVICDTTSCLITLMAGLAEKTK